jgi:PBSX family phage terminase large subunit
MGEIELKRHKFLSCYHHLLEPNDFDIEFVWGGRDSGKSQHVAQQLIYESLSLAYFRCVLIKKTFESIKDSQWQTIKDIAETWQIHDIFTFRISPLEIENKKGNRFISRGCDNPAKLKSIRNPSHVWIEEADQLTLEDFTAIITTLRTDVGRVKIYVVFNPELPKGIVDKKDFWLYKYWFSHTNELNFTAQKVMKVKDEDVVINYRSTNTTYQDNPYCPPERQAFHESLKEMNPSKYLPYTLGVWGSYFNGVPFFYSYNDYHTKDYRIDARQEYYLDIGFDFNIAPCCAVIGQHDRSALTWSIIDVIMTDPMTRQGLSPLQALCQIIKEKYIDSGKVIRQRIRVTGDASGRSGSADKIGSFTYYHTIITMLGVDRGQLFVRSVNHPHIFSAEFINEALGKLKESIILYDVPELDADIKKAYPDEKRGLEEAKKKFGLHILDAWRYLMDFWFCHHSNRFTSNIQDVKAYIEQMKRRKDALHREN